MFLAYLRQNLMNYAETSDKPLLVVQFSAKKNQDYELVANIPGPQSSTNESCYEGNTSESDVSSVIFVTKTKMRNIKRRRK